MPLGSGSLTATPVRLTVLPDGLVIVRVRVEVAASGVLVGLNDLAIVGGNSTASVADAVEPVPPFVELTAPVVLAFAPEVVLVTLTVMVQLLLVLMVAPLRLIVFEPTVFPARVPPEHVVVPTVAMVMPEGKVSLTATPLCATVLAVGLVMVIVIVDVPFTAMLVGLNALVMVGADTTVSVAEAVVPVVVGLVELTVPVVLALLPAVVAVTFTEAVHVPPTAMVPPVKLIEVAPAVGLKVGEPQPLVVALGVEAT